MFVPYGVGLGYAVGYGLTPYVAEIRFVGARAADRGHPRHRGPRGMAATAVATEALRRDQACRVAIMSCAASRDDGQASVGP